MFSKKKLNELTNKYLYIYWKILNLLQLNVCNRQISINISIVRFIFFSIDYYRKYTIHKSYIDEITILWFYKKIVILKIIASL